MVVAFCLHPASNCPRSSLQRSSEFATWLPSEFPMSNGSLHVTMTILVFHLFKLQSFASLDYLFLLLCTRAKIGMEPSIKEEGMWKIKIANTKTISLTTNLTGSRDMWHRESFENRMIFLLLERPVFFNKLLKMLTLCLAYFKDQLTDR